MAPIDYRRMKEVGEIKQQHFHKNFCFQNNQLMQVVHKQWDSQKYRADRPIIYKTSPDNKP